MGSALYLLTVYQLVRTGGPQVLIRSLHVCQSASTQVHTLPVLRKISSLVIVYIGNHWQWWKQKIVVQRHVPWLSDCIAIG